MHQNTELIFITCHRKEVCFEKIVSHGFFHRNSEALGLINKFTEGRNLQKKKLEETRLIMHVKSGWPRTVLKRQHQCCSRT